MSILGIPILSLLIFFPLLGAVILLFIDKEKLETLRIFTLLITLIEFIFSLPLFFAFDTKTAAMQFVEDRWWVQSYGISYKLGVDGISLLLVLLTTFLTVLCILSSWKAIEHRVKEFMISFLILETGMIGALVALDLILFYLLEMMLIPMYLLIDLGKSQRCLCGKILPLHHGRKRADARGDPGRLLCQPQGHGETILRCPRAL
jgi:NADH-quinone oxidoreductase subunit M